jgi:hypothetical protein
VLFRTGATQCNDNATPIITDAACHPLAATLAASTAGVAGNGPPRVTVSCATTRTLPPLVDKGAASICEPAPDDRGCASGETCAPDPAGHAICLVHDGVESVCPVGFETRSVLSASRDERECGPCACNTPAGTCGVPSLELHSNATCTTGLRSAALNGFCNDLSGGGAVDPATHYRFVPAVSTIACAPSATTVPITGSVAGPQVTLCCPP